MKPECNMTEKEYIESLRNTGKTPCPEFYFKMRDWFEEKTDEEKTEWLSKLMFKKSEQKEILKKGFGKTKMDEKKLNIFAYHLYEKKIIDECIVSDLDLDTFWTWKNMPDSKDCIECGKEFDFKPTKEQHLQKVVCDEHLITKRLDIPDKEIPLGTLSFELQHEYWSGILDQTIGELQEAGVVKKV